LSLVEKALEIAWT